LGRRFGLQAIQGLDRDVFLLEIGQTALQFYSVLLRCCIQLPASVQIVSDSFQLFQDILLHAISFAKCKAKPLRTH